MTLSAELENYCGLFSSEESETLKTIRLKTTEEFSASQMVCGPLVANFIQSLIKLNQASRVLDIGTFTGYSAVAMAESLAGIEVITLEKSKEAFDFAVSMFEMSTHAQSIHPRLGEAMDLLETLSGEFDLIFIDADKASTLKYYEWSLSHLSPRGVILVDDVLWYGKVLDPTSDKRAFSMHRFNEYLKADSRVFHVLLPIRHGLQMILKKDPKVS